MCAVPEKEMVGMTALPPKSLRRKWLRYQQFRPTVSIELTNTLLASSFLSSLITVYLCVYTADSYFLSELIYVMGKSDALLTGIR